MNYLLYIGTNELKRKYNYWMERLNKSYHYHLEDKEYNISSVEQQLSLNKTPQRKYFGRMKNRSRKEDPILIWIDQFSYDRENKTTNQKYRIRHCLFPQNDQHFPKFVRRTTRIAFYALCILSSFHSAIFHFNYNNYFCKFINLFL